MDSLLTQLRSLRSQTKLGLALRGLTLSLLTFLATITLLSALDWTWRTESLFSRGLLCLMVWLVITASFVVWLLRPLMRRTSLLDVALWLESIHPEWNGEVAGRLALRSESAEFREDPLDQQQHEALDCAIAKLPVAGRLRAWAVAASLALLLCAGCLLGFTQLRTVGIPRLLWLSQNRWPHRTDLELLTPGFVPFPKVFTLAKSGSGSLELLARDTILPAPDTVLFEWISDDGVRHQQRSSAVYRKRPNGQTEPVFSLLLPPDTGESVRIRARADDDQWMPWHSIIRTVPPTLHDLELVIQPPDYLPENRRTLDNVIGVLPAIAGSRVWMTGRLTGDVAQVIARWPAVADESAPIQADGTFALETIVPQSAAGDAQLLLLAQSSQAGIETPVEELIRRLSFHVQVDQPPAALIEANLDPLSVTPLGRIELTIRAEDDFGLRQVRVIATVDERERTLYESGQNARAIPPQELTERFSFDVAALGAEAGRIIHIIPTASDMRPRHESVRGPDLVLSVVSPEELANLLEQRIEDLATQISRLQEQQHAALDISQTLQEQFADADSDVMPDELGRLLGDLVSRQRDIAHVISEGRDSLPNAIEQISRSVEQNALQRLLVSQFLPEARAELLQAAAICHHDVLPILGEIASPSVDPDTQTGSAFRLSGSALKQAAADQIEILSHLQSAFELLSDTALDYRRRLQRDDLTEELSKLIETTTRLGKETLSQSRDDLSDALRQQLAELAKSHAQLASQAITLFERQGEESSARSPSSADIDPTGRNVADLLNRASRELSDNRVMHAIMLDRRALEELQQASHSHREFPAMAKSLPTDAQELASWAETAASRQREISDEYRSQSPGISRRARLQLANRQAQLADDVTSAVARFSEIPLDNLPTHIASITDGMSYLQEQIREGTPWPDWEADVENVIQQLNELARMLKETSPEQSPSARDVLTMIARSCEELAGEQSELHDQLAAIVAKREDDNLSRGDRARVIRLSREQEQLGDQLRTLQKHSAGFPSIAALLALNLESSNECVRALQTSTADARTVLLQQRVTTRLNRLTQAMQVVISQANSNGQSDRLQWELLRELQRGLIAEEEHSSAASDQQRLEWSQWQRAIGDAAELLQKQ